MGGAAKHLMQLYHDHELTFEEIDEIFRLAGEGQIRMLEKLDGMNIVFTWCPLSMSLRIARNEGDMVNGGMNRSRLAEKFRGRGKVEVAFLESYDALEMGLNAMPAHSLHSIFDSGKRWFSAEVLGPINPNVIHYDSKKVVIHAVNLQPADSSFEPALAELLDQLPKIGRSLAQVDWQIAGPTPVTLRPIEAEKLRAFRCALQNLCESTQLTAGSTVLDFTQKKIYERLTDLGMSSCAAVHVSDRIAGSKNNLNLRQLKVRFPTEAELIDKVVKDDWNFFRKAQESLAHLVDEFAVALTKGAESAHISDSSAEVIRLRQLTQKEIEELQKSDEAKSVEFLKEQLAMLGSVENISTPIEGTVFSFSGKNYKFTGSFAAANRILGHRRYS